MGLHKIFIILILFSESCPAQFINTIAGTGVFGYSGEGLQATQSMIMQPQGVAVDASGNIYFADVSASRVRKISPIGILTTVAGTGTFGFGGDGGQAVNAQLNAPYDVAVDNAGNIYIADGGNFRVRKVSTSGIITTIAGNGTAGSSGDGGAATSASFFYPIGVAVDAGGKVYIADWGNNKIRVVDQSSGNVNSFAGNGIQGFAGDGFPATGANLDNPQDVCVDNIGNVYIADSQNHRVRKVNSAGVISTFAGGPASFYVEGAQATSVGLSYPIAVTCDQFGNVYIVIESFYRLCKVNPAGIITTVSGGWWPNGFAGDGGPAINAKFYYPRGMGTDAQGNLIIGDGDNNRLRKVCFAPITTGSLVGNNLVCPNASNLYSVTPVSGAGSYSWNLPSGWNGSSSTNTINITPNTVAGTISVTAINVCGEPSTTSTLAVNLHTVPAISIAPGNTAICNGATLSITASGANSYTWSTGSSSISVNVSPSVTSIFSVSGTGSNGCNGITAVTVSVKTLPLVLSFASDYVFCSGKSATLTGSGAASYTWTPGNISSTSCVVSPVTNQTYTLEGTGFNGCINKSFITLTVEPTPNVSSTVLFYLCSGAATLSAYNADTYTWMPINLTGSMALVSPTTTTNYTVIGTVGNCTNSSVSTVSLGIAPPMFIASSNSAACKGICFTFSHVSSNFSNLNYDWGDGTSTPTLIPIHCYTMAGNYNVLAQGYYSTGCSVVSANTINITVYPLPTVNILINEGGPLKVNSEVIFINNTSGAHAYQWSFGDSSLVINTNSLGNVVHSYSPVGTYCARLIATDTILNCKDSSKICFEILCRTELTTPNVFTPNNDGVNDIFYFRNECIKEMHCIIYNRWGVKINEWWGPKGWWDGRTDAGLKVVSGTYFYVLEYLDDEEKSNRKSGFISVFSE